MPALLGSIDLGDPNSVSPGILGFIATFFLAVALILLLRNMNGHLRRVRYRAEAEEKAEALAEAEREEAEKAEHGAGPTEADQP